MCCLFKIISTKRGMGWEIIQVGETLSCQSVSFIGMISKSHDLISLWRRCKYSLKHPSQPHVHPRIQAWASSQLGLLHALPQLTGNYMQSKVSQGLCADSRSQICPAPLWITVMPEKSQPRLPANEQCRQSFSHFKSVFKCHLLRKAFPDYLI